MNIFMPVYLLDERIAFPPPHLATDQGLLAVGGDLSIDRLLLAYRLGIFPWFSDNEPILWWSPDPRLVLYPEELHIPKSLLKILKRDAFEVTLDTAFDKVIHSCAAIRRKNNEGTWITKEMIDAYIRLHKIGVAHSAEAWFNGKLAGGLYGVSLDRCFFGESMFSHISNASKVAFVKLVEHLNCLSFHMIDCQVTTEHLKQFGAREIPRDQFLKELALCLSNDKGKPTDGSRFSTPTPFFSNLKM